jgi:ferredoxin
VIGRDGLDRLLGALSARGYTVIGPTVRDGAILYEQIASTADLPEGWTDEQEGGSYRLRRRDDDALFGFNVGPNSWKSHLFPPKLTLWHSQRGEAGEVSFEQEAPEAVDYAFIGVRSCDLAAIGIQDRVLIGDSYADPDYQARREGAFIVAVNCGEAGNTCFCVSMGTGPRASAGFDLALTELLEGEHRFLVRAGSAAGEAVLAELPTRPATREDVDAAGVVVAAAAREMNGRFDAAGVHDLLLGNLESPVWDDVAERCVTCGNCTLVCPTCFCTHVEDTSSLDGAAAGRERVWDTCFSVRYAEMHGGNTRPTPRARYRQWLTHKLATWEDQFGSSGCVGCGRCIAWCPVGIDIRAEVAAIRSASDSALHTRGDTHAHA